MPSHELFTMVLYKCKECQDIHAIRSTESEEYQKALKYIGEHSRSYILATFNEDAADLFDVVEAMYRDAQYAREAAALVNGVILAMEGIEYD